MRDQISTGKRVFIGISAPVLLGLLCLYEYLGGTGLECFFYKHTGWYCPGCGSGRAVRALFHGDVGAIFHYNILLPVLGIPCLFILIHEYLRIVFPGLKLKAIRISQPVLDAVIAVIFLFWVLRNIPFFSFLAPGI